MSPRPSALSWAALAFALLGASHAVADSPAASYLEPFRPQYHFTPAQNWMNDPNGLISYAGENHLFYQYNPFGTTWGIGISWGHAVSTDMVHWTELPVAIPATPAEAIFSGSAVVDVYNTSGFGTSGNPPMVAVYTVLEVVDATDPSDGSVIPGGTQAQAIAYSTDKGRTWTKYAGNPVINPWKDPSIDPGNFRDPKVFWHEASKRWVMVVALSGQHQIRFYSSPDLKSWTHMSDFGPANAVQGVWECPDLFPLAVDGDPSKTKWVLSVNLNPGSVASGSGAQHFIGTFDGQRFLAEDTISTDPPAGKVFQDFETGASYAGLGWTATGDFAGLGPAAGSLPGQSAVTGLHGSRLINTFTQGDAAVGAITSPAFTISSKYINLLVGGGNHPHDPNTTLGAPPPGDLLFPGADLEPSVPGTTTYEQLGWTTTGAMVNQPVATGAIGGQQAVSGFAGAGLIDTFTGGSDQGQGTLTSPTFTINHPYINFLVGGGGNPYPAANETAVLLEVNGVVVRSATGQDQEMLNWVSWDVSAYVGQQADIKVVDASSGGWGHINADQFLGADVPALPVSTETAVNLLVDGKVVRSATGQNSEQLAWVAWNVGEFAGHGAQIQVLDMNSGGWGHLMVDDIVFSARPKEQANWTDRGRDFYAVNSWNDSPNGDRRWIAWMNNWQYGGVIPTSPWRSAQSIPREVALKTFEDGVRLVQRPIPELAALRDHAARLHFEQESLPAGETALTGAGASGNALEITAEFEPGTATEFGVKVRKGSGEETLVGYNVANGEVFVDRTRSGQSGFSNLFTNNGASYPSRETAPVRLDDGRVKLHIYVDWSSVEVFADEGRAVITDQIFPASTSSGTALFATGGRARLVSLDVRPLHSIWTPH